jgi:NADPH-dependent 2,4-dienoyl-CoA reductase/sulfur reductase-like enzyme
MRFPLAIVGSIHNKCGTDFPVIIRYSADEWVPGGRELPESIEVAKTLEASGVAALDLSQCIQESPGAGFDPMYYPEGWTIYASEAIKKEVSIPVIISHTLRNPEYCEQVIAEGKTDMVGLARQMLADPYWPIKAKYGKSKSIRKCISCLTGCWQESMMAKKEIACAVNPACGNKDFAVMEKTKNPLNIAVVGGGPAGMEAARVAAERGHSATIFEKTGELGGAMLGCCVTPGKEKMKWYADWVRYQIADLNIPVKLCTTPGISDLKSFDVVVNATGASSYVPECSGLKDSVIPFEKVVACPKVSCDFHPGDGRKPKKLEGNKIIVWGDHYAATDTVAHLASIGKEVIIVTDRKEFASSVEVIHMYVLRKWFKQTDAEALSSKMFRHPVKVYESCTINEIRKGEVVLIDKNLKRTTIKYDHVVTCWTRPNTGFLKKMKDAGLPVVNVGDSVSPRNLHAAVKTGAGMGLVIDSHRFFNPNNTIIDEVPVDIAGQLKR